MDVTKDAAKQDFYFVLQHLKNPLNQSLQIHLLIADTIFIRNREPQSIYSTEDKGSRIGCLQWKYYTQAKFVNLRKEFLKAFSKIPVFPFDWVRSRLFRPIFRSEDKVNSKTSLTQK